MKGRLIAAILTLGGFGLTWDLSASVPLPAGTLPYYDSRDFTPRWAPVSHRVGPFRLVDQQNRSITDLCPTLVQKLKPVQEAIRGRDDVVMVSYSVTPLTDTPEVLADFGRLRGIDPARWRLLTGELSEIQGVIRGSYFADDLRPIEGEPQSRILHTEKVLLVDRGRRLRGIYNGTNAFEMERLVEDIEALRRESRTP